MYNLELPVKPIYGDTEATVYLTPKQTAILQAIGIEEIVGEDKTRLRYWFTDKWVKITPETTATIIAKLSELATKDPQNKNMATRVTKLLTEKLQGKWENLQTAYERHVKYLKELANSEYPVFIRELSTAQYGYELTAKERDNDYGWFVTRATIAPVPFIEDGKPVVKWTADTGGMYLTLGGNDERRTKQQLFDEISGAIAYAHELVDTMLDDKMRETIAQVTTAQELVAQLENA